MNKTAKVHLAITTIIAVLVRAWLWFEYPIFSGNDSATYLHLANSLRNNLGFGHYNGTRTPGYPFFLALINDLRFVYFAQLTLGILTTLLIFWLTFQLTNNSWAALAASLSHTLNIQQLLFEGALLSEALCAFLFVVLLWLTVNYFAAGEKRTLRQAVTIGLVTVLLASVRSLFLTVPFCILAVILLRDGVLEVWRKKELASALITPILIATIIWVGYIYLQFNVVGLDSMGGYHKVNFVSSYFEKAPDQYQQVTDIFLKYRTKRITESGSAVNTIWDAIPELMQVTKKNYYALGNMMGEISDTLAKDNPIDYGKNVALGWLWFWKGGVVWQPDNFARAFTQKYIGEIVAFERYFAVLCNVVFLLLSLFSLLKKRFLQADLFIPFATGFVLLTSVLQAFAEHGDNARFLAPAQSLVFVVLIVFINSRFEKRKQSRI